jgi:hypothetical protein
VLRQKQELFLIFLVLNVHEVKTRCSRSTSAELVMH